jgi:arginyl-tRNA synthetase
MPFFNLKQKLAEEIAISLSHPEITAQSLSQDFSAPPNLAMGHVALPCFKLGKILNKPAGKLAIELAQTFKSPLATASATGPYANFKFKSDHLFETTLSKILAEKEKYGSEKQANPNPIVLEYCSPNIAKPLFFHHIRSTLIGNVLGNIYDFLGYKTERINFVGDWGTQFARLLAAFELWGHQEELSLDDLGRSMKHLLDIYIKFHQEVDTHPEYLEKTSQWLQRLEAQDPSATKLWKLIRDISVANMEKTLSKMHVFFHYTEGESHYIPKMDATLKEIKAKADAKLSEGAYIVELPDIETPALVQKRDGTTLYLTRDIAAAIERFERFHFSKMYYVVSEQQKLHFKQLFAVLKKMGYGFSDSCEHLSFGTVHFGKERMSTREGRVIYLEDVLKEATELALEECTKKNPALVGKEEIAQKVGIGAIIFGELSAHRQRDIEFQWEHVLTFDGETGPYVQYSAVRCQSLLSKAKEANIDYKSLAKAQGYNFAPEEEALVLELAKFRGVLKTCTQDNEPYHLPRYLIDIAKAFNRFYYQLPVLQATDLIQKQVRLNLVEATYQVLFNGLKLLGIDTPKEM